MKPIKSINDYIIDRATITPAKSSILSFIKYKSTPITENDLDIHFIVRFGEYLVEKGLANNTIRLHNSILISILKRAKRLEYSFNLNFDDANDEMKVKKEASESVYTNAKEIQMLIDYEPVSEPEKFCRAIYLLGALTGTRVSDSQRLTANNLRDGEVHYTSEKTKTTSMIPMHPLVPELIKIVQEFDYDENSIRSIIGIYIKKIYKKLGLIQRMTLYRRGEKQIKYKL